MSRKSEIRAALRENHPVHDAVAIGRATHAEMEKQDPETMFGETDQPDVDHQTAENPSHVGLAKMLSIGQR